VKPFGARSAFGRLVVGYWILDTRIRSFPVSVRVIFSHVARPTSLTATYSSTCSKNSCVNPLISTDING